MGEIVRRFRPRNPSEVGRTIPLVRRLDIARKVSPGITGDRTRELVWSTWVESVANGGSPLGLPPASRTAILRELRAGGGR